jgi:type I restriction enzyme, S subunit
VKAGWKKQTVGEVLRLEYGKPLDEADRKLDGQYPVYGANGEKNRTYKFYCGKPSIIIGRKGSAGEINLTEPKFWPLDVTYFVTFDERQHDLRFLYYLLTTLDLPSLAKGVKPGINRNEVYSQVTKVPQLPEQQRIVSILDEAFDGIATAKANAEKNLQNARALFESHLHAVFSQRDKGWDRATLETLLDRGWIESHLDGNHGGDYPRKQEFINEGVPYISAKCLVNDRVNMACAKYLSPSRAALLRKGIAKDNDVLFAHNATVGPVAILHTDEEKVILGTSLTYYRCNPKQIMPEYLAHYMRSFEFKMQYLTVMRQSTRNQVPITKQREFYHVIPPLREQGIIVSELDNLFNGGKRLESIYQQKLTALDALKKSLLHQAFAGQL